MTSLRMIVIAMIIIAVVAVSAIYMRKEGGEPLLADQRFQELVSGKPEELSVAVEGLDPNGRFYKDYTCDGGNMAPKVKVTGVPGKAVTVALIVYDPDAPRGTFIHWLAYQDALETLTFPSPNAVEGRNDFRGVGYGGPCPPKGDNPHRYFFLAIALDDKLELPRGYEIDDILDSMRGHVVSWGYTVGTYSR